MHKGFALPLVILMALVILLVGFYYLKTKTPSFKQDQPETKSEIRDTSNDSETISLEDKPEFKSIVNIQNSDTANWKTYLDLKTKVSFKYPQKYVYSDVFYKRTGNLSFFESKENMLDAEKNAIEGCGGCNFLINTVYYKDCTDGLLSLLYIFIILFTL